MTYYYGDKFPTKVILKSKKSTSKHRVQNVKSYDDTIFYYRQTHTQTNNVLIK